MLRQDRAHIEIGGSHHVSELLPLRLVLRVSIDSCIRVLLISLGDSHLFVVRIRTKIDVRFHKLITKLHGIAIKATTIAVDEIRLGLRRVRDGLAEVDGVFWYTDGLGGRQLALIPLTFEKVVVRLALSSVRSTTAMFILDRKVTLLGLFTCLFVF